MAREQRWIIKSDLSGSDVDESEAMVVRLEYLDPKKRSYWTLDVAEREVSELMSKATEHKKRGRAPGTKVGPRKNRGDDGGSA